jgi:hypothetical protein
MSSCGHPEEVLDEPRLTCRVPSTGNYCNRAIELINVMGKGRVKRLAGSDAQGQAKFVATLFEFAA